MKVKIVIKIQSKFETKRKERKKKNRRQREAERKKAIKTYAVLGIKVDQSLGFHRISVA